MRYHPAMPITPEAPSAGVPNPLVEVRNLVKQYGDGRDLVRVVDDVSFDIRPGETLGLVGESGSGKSTVARMVLGLLQSTSGEVWFQGEPLPPLASTRMRHLRRQMQIVFQDPYAALTHQRQRAHCPSAIELVRQLMFVRETIETTTRWMLGRGQHCHVWATCAVRVLAPNLVEPALAVLPQRFGNAIDSGGVQPGGLIHRRPCPGTAPICPR